MPGDTAQIMRGRVFPTASPCSLLSTACRSLAFLDCSRGTDRLFLKKAHTPGSFGIPSPFRESEVTRFVFKTISEVLVWNRFLFLFLYSGFDLRINFFICKCEIYQIFYRIEENFYFVLKTSLKFKKNECNVVYPKYIDRFFVYF